MKDGLYALLSGPAAERLRGEFVHFVWLRALVGSAVTTALAWGLRGTTLTS